LTEASPTETVRWPGALRASLLLAFVVLALPLAAGDDDEEPKASPGRSEWRIELKRQFTDRSSVEESSRTTIRLETAPSSVLALVRLDLPFVDKKNGDPSTPGWGDFKIRVGLLPETLGGAKVRPFVEATFPTSDPGTLGGGKYQASAGARFAWPLDVGCVGGFLYGAKGELDSQLQQTFSVAGDPDRKDVNTTKVDLGVRTVFSRNLSVGLKPKMTIDWVQNGKTGAVLEADGSWTASRRWRVALTIGTLLWGDGVPGTYGNKVEVSLRLTL
jgi:hypothetical protein